MGWSSKYDAQGDLDYLDWGPWCVSGLTPNRTNHP
jgi:hypothetical protein